MNFIYLNVLFYMLIPSLFLMFLILTKKEKLLNHFSKESLNKLSLNNKYLSNKARTIILFLALILMIIALARPVINEQEHKTKQELYSIVVAIDISKSMLANDIYPNRLEFAKKKLLGIIDESKNNSLGLILFARNSFIISPLSVDFNSLKLLVENLDSNLGLAKGTNIHAALEMANKLLKDSSSKNIILLTDGSDSKEFSKEIEYANKNNISVYSLTIGTKKGAPIKEKNGDYLTDNNGNIVNLKLNESIKDLSLNTNGGYINASITNSDIKEVLSDIYSKSLKNNFESINHKTYTELFYYPLGLSILLMFIAFSSLPKFKQKSNLVLFVLLFVSFDKTYAYTFNFEHIKNANNAYEKQEYKKAQSQFEKIDSSYEQSYNLANTLYKQKKYKEAIEKYKSLKHEDINKEAKRLHNLGNAYAKNNDFKKAISAYEEALKRKDDKHTKENLEAIKKHLKNKQENKKQQENKKSSKNKKEQKQKENKEQKNKSQKQKNENSSKEKKEKEEKNKTKEKSNKDNKNKTESKNINKENKDTKKINKKEEISQLEEKRWLNKLKHQKTKTFMKEMQSSNKENINSPW